MRISRRDLIRASGACALTPLWACAGQERGASAVATNALDELKPMTEGLEPISLAEHRGRIERAQRLMGELGFDALVLGPGTNLTYFSGVSWGLSERFMGMVLTREGDPAWVTPAFEQRRAEEQIEIGSDVRPWQEHESPYDLVAKILKDRKAGGGRVGLGERLSFQFANGIAQSCPAAEIQDGTKITAGCRMIKDAHELALMRRANQITVAAHRAVFASLQPGLTQGEARRLSSEAHRRLGISGGSLILFGADAAFPHGTTKPKPLEEGDLVLIDGGGRLHGYSSDITRTAVFGEPTAKQRRLWQLVRDAQQAAFEIARPGVECQALDAAARLVLEQGGFGPDYRYLTHRLGHGIGMDGHEWTYLVRGNTTLLEPGMCFSNEPGIYIPGELGIRHEDIITITEAGAENLTRWSGTPEDPAVV